MTRRLMMLNGLAIVAVVSSHTSDWGFLRLNGGAVPDATQGAVSMSLYALLFLMTKLTSFSVPAFLFTAGAFMVYADRNSAFAPTLSTALKTANWRMLRNRLVALVLPYAFWSVVIFGWKAAGGSLFPWQQYVSWLLTGRTISGYYFVPLLCQFIVLSPLIVWLARHHCRTLLILAAALQFGVMGLEYLNVFHPVPILEYSAFKLRYWSFFPTWAFFFALGVVYTTHSAQIKPWIIRHRKWLLTGAIAAGVLALVEAQWLLSDFHVNWRYSPLMVTSSAYALSFIFAFLAYEHREVPFSKAFLYLSSRTFGIYLLNQIVLRLCGDVIDGNFSWLTNHIPLYPPVMMGLAIGIPLAIMIAVVKSPARKYYRYLFG